MKKADRIKRRFELIHKLISKGDIDELYGREQPTLNRLQGLTATEIPNEVDQLIEAGFEDSDIDFLSLDLPLQDLIRVLVLGGRSVGGQIRWRVLTTKVERWIVEARPASVSANAPEVSIERGCPECGTNITETPNKCPNCGWKSNQPV